MKDFDKKNIRRSFHKIQIFPYLRPHKSPPNNRKNYERIIHKRQSAKEWQHCKTFVSARPQQGLRTRQKIV